MRTWRRWKRRVRALVFRSRVEQELSDELRAHLEIDAEARMRRGVPPERARREAAVAFGGVDAVTEACRDTRGMGFTAGIAADVRTAWRGLARTPTYALSAIGVMALGIGAATAVFSVAESVLLRPLPYDSPERLYSVYESNGTGGRRLPSYPTFIDWTKAANGFEALAYIRGESMTVQREDAALMLLVGYVTPGFFELLGGAPVRGRVFSGAEAAGADATVVLAHHTWRSSFGGDPGIVGREISTEYGPATVIGVMPEGFRYPEWADLWLPLDALPASRRAALERRDLHVDSRVAGRIASAATAATATERLSAVAERVARLHADGAGWGAVELTPVRDEALRGAQPRVLVLCGAVALLLLLACANASGLMLARMATRGREIATRIALGAGRGRIVRQMLVESALVVAVAGVLGLLLADLSVRLVAARAPGALPRLEAAALNGWVVLFAIGAGAVAALLAGVVPALRSAGVSPMTLLRSARGGVSHVGEARARSILVAGEIALATMLVVGAVLLFRTIAALGTVELGFDPGRLAVVRVTPPSPRYDAPESALALYGELEAAARRVPGVERVALVNHLPLTGTSMPTEVRTGRALAPDETGLALYRAISADYLVTFGIPVRAGRAFTAAEVNTSAPVALVNEVLAAREWPDGPAVGRTMTITKVAQGRADFGERVSVTVVGVLTDTRDFGPASEPVPAVYVPLGLAVWPNTFLAARTTGDPARAVEALRRAMLDVDPLLPIAGPGFTNQVRPLTDYAANLVQDRRVNAAVLGAFAATAFLLAAVGVFGLVAYLTAQRRREFGVRMSLGAEPSNVIRLVVGGGLRLALAGIAAGLAGALFASRLLRGLLFGVEPTDPRSFVIAATLFLVAALLASAIPALRAARTPPASVLRDD